MMSLVFGLHALPQVAVAPLPVIGPLVLAAGRWRYCWRWNGARRRRWWT